MALSLRQRLQRRVLPSLVVRLSRRVTLPQRWARLRARLGWPPRLELYFAFDDPYAVVALPGLLGLLRHRPARLRLYPLIERGIPADPAAAARRHHALIDTGRLLGRGARRLTRSAPLNPDSTAFLAAWTQAARAEPGAAAFAAAALEQLWLSSNGPVRREDFVDLHRRLLGRDPPRIDAETRHSALAGNHRRLLAKGHWESPAARLEGEWFFAHERLPHLERRLAQLSGSAM